MDKERRLNAAKYYISNSKLVEESNCNLKVSIMSFDDGITSVKYRCGKFKGVVQVHDTWFSEPNNLKAAIQSALSKKLKSADVDAELKST